MSTNNTSIPGMIYPTVNSYTPGANSPSQSAMLTMQNNNKMQANLNASVGGKKKNKKYSKKKQKSKQRKQKQITKKLRQKSRKNYRYKNYRLLYKKGGNNNTITVPQFQMNYTNVGGIAPNQQIASGAQISTQNAAWSNNDNLASKLYGGKKRN